MPISRWTSKQLIWFFCLTVVRGAQNDSGFDLVYMEQADTSYMYHILTYAVKNSTFAGNATAGNGQKILVEGPSVPYTTIEFTVLRLRPSDKPMFSEEKIPDYTEEELAEFEADDKLVMEKPPILLSNNHVELENGVKMSFYDYLSTNEHTKDEWADMTEEERNYWKNASFVFQSWCEDPVCPPDESILYKHQCVEYELELEETVTMDIVLGSNSSGAIEALEANDNYTVKNRRKRRSINDDDNGEEIEVTFKKQMDATNFAMSGGSVVELRDLLQEKTKVEFMSITDRQPKTQMKLLNYKDVNGLDDVDLNAIDMPYGAKLYDIEAEANDNQAIQLGRIVTRGEQFRQMQHGTG